MTFMLDTNVVIHLRDGDAAVGKKIRALGDGILISAITRAELEGGVHSRPEEAKARRVRLDKLLTATPTIAFAEDDAVVYGQIIASVGYSRRKVFDRMIAAQAIVVRATLVTMNADDFSDVPGLKLLSW